MQLFITSHDPEECVDALADQLLPGQLALVDEVLKNALAAHEACGPLTTPEHPDDNVYIRWASTSWPDFMWVASYGISVIEALDFIGVSLPEMASIIIAGRTGFLMAGGEDALVEYPKKWPLEGGGYVTGIRGLTESYRELLRDEYAKMFYTGEETTWTNREPPPWVTGSQ